VVLPAWFALFLVFLILEQAANVLGKQFALSGRYRFAVLSLLSFFACELPWIFSLRIGLKLSEGAVLFSVVPAILAMLIGSLVYKEKATRSQFVGLMLGIVAIALLSLE
jgi:multidrug transporter EmrE-like cation transporter